MSHVGLLALILFGSTFVRRIATDVRLASLVVKIHFRLIKRRAKQIIRRNL